MFGTRATWFRDFNTKNAYPRQYNEAWVQNLEVRLPIHRKCQNWPWFCKYIKCAKRLERPVWSLETRHNVHDRIQIISWPWINSTIKTHQTIAKVQNVRNRPIARLEATDQKLSAKVLLLLALEDGSSLFQWLEQYLSQLNQTRLSCPLGSSQWFHVGGSSLAGLWRARMSGDGDVVASRTKELLVGPDRRKLAKNAKTKLGWPNARSSDAIWCNVVQC